MKRVFSLILALIMMVGMLPSAALASENENNPWSGRSAVFVGDSITAGDNASKYYRLLEQSLGLGSVTVMGVGGSCISAYSDYGTGNQPLINRYQTIPSTDLIMVFMGTNDYGHETPLGTVADTQDGTFYGALNTIIPALVAKHTSSKIVFVTPLHRYGFGTSKILGTQFTYDNIPNGVGATLGDYVDALKTVCASNGVSVIDLHTEYTLDPSDADVRAEYMPDGIHPNAAGHEVVAGIMESHLRTFEPVESEPVVLAEMIQGNKFASTSSQPCRASSRINYYLKAGTVITLKDPDAMQWACAKTSNESSSNNLGYFPDSQWTDKETAVVAEDGWVGFTFKYRDETQVFDLTKPLSDYITIHTHSYKNGICTSCGAEHPNLANYEGKVISILGDSISTFAGYIPTADGFNLEHLARYPQDNLLTDVNETWWMQVINKLGAKLGINDSWRGATVSGAAPVTTGTTGENAAMANLTRIQNLGANGTPDVILFYGGTNDLAHVSKVGTFNVAAAPAEVDLTTKKWDNLADGYAHTLLRLRHYYPNATIIGMLPTYTTSYYSADKLAQANAVLAQICEHYGVAYVDLRDCGISTADLPDGIHPDATGMDYITAVTVDALLGKCEIGAGENVVHSVTHKLTGAESTLGYYKGVTHGKPFVTTISGEDVTVSVTMGGEDITDAAYANGVISIAKVTGDIVITAEGRVKPVYEDHLQQLPEATCSETNLWAALEHDKQYYTVSGWGTHSSGKVYSVTFPVSGGDRIFATSFGAAGTNGSSTNGIRVTWFDENGVLKTVSPDTVYSEFSAKGYLAVPDGAAVVSIPVWNIDYDNEIYILNRDHCYENGVCAGCGVAQWDTDGDGVLEILAIGNSFSVDALQYAYQITQNLGIEKIAIGNLYIGGCTLATHATNAAGDLGKYTYYYNDNGTWTSTGSYKISTALESRSWDYVSMQQGSPVSGVESSYNEDLTKLIAYVQERSDAKLVWHMTWAYQQNSTHSAFPTYDRDQMTMYNAIVSAVQNKIVTNNDIDLIVPNGTAVQNSRTSLLGDTTTRDGYHMSYDYGRYLTGLLFIKTITGLSVDDVTYAPSGVDAEEKAIAVESANNAAAKPFAVTKSKYVNEVPEEGYILLKPELYKGAYWHPLKNGSYNELIDDQSNSPNFFATIRFTRETLPVGSIITLESGWQYRPDGWVTDTLQTGTRESVTTKAFEAIDEEWWGDYTIRSFNISRTSSTSVMDLTEEEMRSIFRIYVPEEKHTHVYADGTCTLCGEVQPGPVITQQPADSEAALGENFCVTVEAEGEGLKYQWYFRNKGSDKWYKSAVRDNTYDDVMTKERSGREVYCVITDADGNSVTTGTAKLIRVLTEELEITRQPANGEAALGETYCVTVEAKGEDLKYQWYIRSAGAKAFTKSSVRTNTYSDVMTKTRAGREIYCVITDANGNTVTTDTVKLVRIPSEALAITKQPESCEVKLGERYCVTVEAKGENLKYHWYFRNAGAKDFSKSSVTDNTYDDVLTASRVDREVYCVITDCCGNSVTTDTVKLLRTYEELAIAAQPVSSETALGEKFCVTVQAKGEGLKYQWHYRNAGTETWHKSGVRDNTYDDVMTAARAGREIYCVITDRFGNSVTTDTVKLVAVVTVELEITQQPDDAEAPMGERYCVTVEAKGEGLRYQWYFRNTGSKTWHKSSVTDNTYDDEMTDSRAGREVYCVITDAAGNQVTSDTVKLICTEPASTDETPAGTEAAPTEPEPTEPEPTEPQTVPETEPEPAAEAENESEATQ